MRGSPSICRPTASTATSIWCVKTSARAPVAPGARPMRLTLTSRRSCKISCPASTPIRSGLFHSIPLRGGRGMRLPTSRTPWPSAQPDTEPEISSALRDFIRQCHTAFRHAASPALARCRLTVADFRSRSKRATQVRKQSGQWPGADAAVEGRRFGSPWYRKEILS